MKVSRKEFVGGVLAFAGRAACPQAAASGGRLSSAAASAREDTRPPVMRKIIAAGFAYPEACANIPGECLFSVTELSPDKPIRFTVTPRDCFALAGRPLVSTLCLSERKR